MESGPQLGTVFPAVISAPEILSRALLLVLLDLVVGVSELASKVVEHARHRQP